MPTQLLSRRSKANQIRLWFDADPDGTLSLQGFLSFLERLRGGLYYTARDPDEPSAKLSVTLRIADMSHPDQKRFSVVAQASVRNGQVITAPVGKELVSGLRLLSATPVKEGPPIRDMDVLQAYQRLTEPVEKQVSRVTIAAGGKSVAITKDYVERLARIIGPDRREHGSISGRLLRVNLYRTHRFDIFPSVGPRRVACSFEERDQPKVITALGGYVTVQGILKFKHWDAWPYAVKVKDIEPHDESRLPTLDDLRGMVPREALGGKSSEEFVDSIREEDW